MDGRFNTLAQQLFQKSLEHCSIEELKGFAEQYPYFAPAHFLLLKKLPTGSDEYNTQYQKAIIYYHSPAQFSSFMNPPSFENNFTYAAAEPEIAQSESLAATPEPEPEVVDADIEPEPYIEPVAEVIPQPEEDITIAEASVPQPPFEEPSKEEPATLAASQEPVSELTFEPFHTVDYFASQGIRLSQEELPKDQLGKQMKSFTEWLKTMKRLPATELVKAVDSSAEKKVENLAQHSLQSADVVTEAMAEVWLRQGQPQKALDIYNKLSLQNPPKRAYFAAKIENLKKSL